MSRTSRFLGALARRPLVLDAAMGTRLIARGLDLGKDDPALWNLDRPEDVLDIHRRDVEAGADAVLTNTFGADRISLGRLGRSAEANAINLRAVELAREAAGPDRFILGSLGPSAAFDDEATRAQVFVLADAGADALFFETHTEDQARARLRRFKGPFPLPVLVALCCRGNRTFNDLDAIRLPGKYLGVSAFGTNCLRGMVETLPLTGRMQGEVDVPLIAKPSAGLPHEKPADPESFAEAVPRLLALGVRLVGGCCGTNEAHVAALRRAIDSALASGMMEASPTGPIGSPPT